MPPGAYPGDRTKVGKAYEKPGLEKPQVLDRAAPEGYNQKVNNACDAFSAASAL